MRHNLGFWLFSIFTLSVTSEELDVRLPQFARPEHYQITVETFLYQSTFTGTVQIRVRIINLTNRIILHSKGLVIKDITASNAYVINSALNVAKDFLVISLDRNLLANSLTEFTIRYQGNLSNENVGYYRAPYLNQLSQIRYVTLTHLEPTNARRAFPCFDEPNFKATFQINLIRNITSITTSNMNRIGSIVLPGNRYRDEYNKSVPMSTYLVAFMVSDYDYLSMVRDGITYRTFGRPQLIARGDGNYSLAVAPNAIQAMETYTTVQYPLITLDNVPVPDDHYKIGAMENWGMVTYREQYLMHNNLLSTASDTQFTATLVVHELAHQWFGNLVTPVWWDYIWLNEGLATYFEMLITSQLEPNWRLMEQFATVTMQYAFEFDASGISMPMIRNVSTPAEIEEIYDTVTYEKAGLVVRMAANFLGEAPFRNGLTTYLLANRFQNVNSTHLYSSWQAALAATTNLNVSLIMESWETQSGYPVVTVTRLPNGTAILNQQRFLQYETKHHDRTVWHIPLNWFTVIATTNTITWFKDQNAMLNLNVNNQSWVIFNVNRMGFYRVNYNEANWRLIIDYLRAGTFPAIPVINRAQLIDDAFSLARSHRLNFSIALDIGSYIQNETEEAPIVTFTHAYDHLYRLSVGRAHFNTIEAYGRRTLEGYFNRTNFIQQNDPHLTRMTKVAVLTWLCRLNHQACRTHSTEAFNIWINQNTAVQPDSQNFIFCNGIRAGTDGNWNTALDRYRLSVEAAQRTRIAQGLGCSSNQATLRRLLNMLTDQGSVFSSSDRIPVVTSVYTNNGVQGVNIVLQWLTDNFPLIEERVGSTASIISAVTNRVTTNDQLTLFSRFVNENGEHFTEDHNATIEFAFSTVQNNLEWIKDTSTIIEDHFTGNVGGAGGGGGSGNTIYISGFLLLISIFLQIWFT